MVQDETTQAASAQEVNVTRRMAKRTAKNSVFLDLFKDKKSCDLNIVHKNKWKTEEAVDYFDYMLI